MIRVLEYTENINYISDSYNYQSGKQHQEFSKGEDLTVKLIISGLTREKAKELRNLLTEIGIAP